MAFTSEDIVGSIMPRIYVSRIILQSTSGDKLLANLQFVMKDRFSNDNISSWIEQDPDLLKYISVCVVQSSNSELTNKLEREIESFAQSANPEDLQTLTALRPQKDYKIFKPFAGKDLLTLQQMVESDLAERIETEPGITEYNIYFDVTFEESDTIENPEHLSYIFYTFYDADAALQDTNELLSIPEITGDSLAGVAQLQIEKVIVDGKILDTSYIYIDEQQNIWPGPIHTRIVNVNGRSVEVYRSGQFEDSQSVDLQRVEIENNKVQDFRQLERIITLQRTDVAPLDEEFIGSFKENQIEELFSKSNSSISELFHSIDKDKNVSLTFALDFKQMFLNNSTYGQILKNIINSNTQNGTSNTSMAKVQTAKNLLNTLYLMAEIEDITLKCKRMDIDDSINPIKQAEEVVFSASGRRRIASIERNTIFANKPEQIRVFSASDRVAKQNGVYNYSVEINYHDKTKDIISQIVDLLKLEQRKFKTYYEYAILPNVFNQVTKRFRANAFSELQTIQTDIQTEIENTAENLRQQRRAQLSLAQSFFRTSSAAANIASNQILQGNNRNLLETILDFPNSITIYLTVLQKFFAVETNSTIEPTIRRWLNPISATPESISYVIQLYDELISSLESIILMTKTVDSSLNEKGENVPKENVQSASKVINIRKSFRNKVDLNSSYILEYLNNMAIDSTNSYAEVSKGYESLKVDLINKKLNQFAHLSVANQEENIEEKTYDNLNEILGYFANVSIYDDLFYINNRQAGYNPVVEQNSQTRNDLSVSYPSVQQSLLKQIRAQQARLEAEDKVIVNPLLLKLINPTLLQNTENIVFTKNDKLNAQKNLFQKIEPTSATIQASIAARGGSGALATDSIIDFIKGTTIPVSYLNNIPNQIKSLFQLKTLNPQIPVNDAESRLKYEMLKNIQYLDGFEFDSISDIYKMNSPLWKTLKNLSSFIDNQQKLLFCRLKNYNDDVISYKFNSSLNEITTNEHFFLNVRGYHEDFTVVNGATNISSDMFEQRLKNELTKYFDGDTEPPVSFTIGGKQITPSGGYLATYYSFLGPHGLYFDNTFKVLGTYIAPQIVQNGTTPAEAAANTIEYQFVGFELLNSNTGGNTAVSRQRSPVLGFSSLLFSRNG